MGVSFVVLASPAGARQPSPGGETVGGTIRKPDGKPVPNVTLTVRKNKLQVGTGTTGADGQWTVPVPGPGVYQVSIDVTTLPTGVNSPISRHNDASRCGA